MAKRSVSWGSSLSMVLLGSLLACESTTETQPPDDASALPLLAPGQFLSTTSYGSAPGPGEGPTRSLVGQAAGAGMKGFAFWIDWPNLELSTGGHDFSILEERLRWVEGLGLTPYLNLTVVDIVDLNLPGDLLNSDGTGLASGVRLDDPSVLARFNQVLDGVVPLLVRHGGFYLGLGNEVDARFEEFPDELDPYVEFVRAAREHIRSIDPQMAVGVTVTGTAVLERRPTFNRLRAISDVVPFNFYNIESGSLLVMSGDRALSEFDRAISNYGPGPIVIQELGCTSSPAQQSSIEIQRACFEGFFEALRGRYPQVRFASVFTLQDLDSVTCDTVMELFGIADENLSPEFVARIRGFFCEVGLRAADGSAKPAWDEFVAAVARLGAG